MTGMYGYINIDKDGRLNVGTLEPQEGIFGDDDMAVAAIGEIFEPKTGLVAKTIAELYHKYGEGCALKIEGQCNFCIWDKKEHKVIVATDRFGTSIINYYSDANCLIFASRISEILKTKTFSPAIDKDGLYSYLSLTFVPTPQTIYKEIKKLPPGHMIIMQNGRVDIKKYWDVYYGESRNRNEKFYAEKMYQTMEEAVRKRFDIGAETQNIGAFLSGGLDSSTVAGMMKKISGQARTFSIGFAEQGYSELEYVNIAAKHFGLKSYQYIVKPKDLLEAVNVLVKEYDEPFGNPSGIAAYYCMKLAKDNGVDIMLGGDGGDENFAGYERYVKDKIYSFYQGVPRFLRKGLVEPIMLHSPFSKVKNYIKHSNIPNPERFFMYELYPMSNRKEIFSEDFLAEIDQQAPLKVAQNYFNTPDTDSELSRLLYLDTKIGLVDNDLRNKIDKISRVFDIKVRHSMLDAKLWELGAEIPPGLKLKGLTKKYIFKKAFWDFLPKEIIYKKKHGFGVPYAVWLKTDKAVRDFTHDRLLDPKVERRGIFKKGFFEKILKAHDEEKTSYYGDMIWIFLMLEIWHDQWQKT